MRMVVFFAFSLCAMHAHSRAGVGQAEAVEDSRSSAGNRLHHAKNSTWPAVRLYRGSGVVKWSSRTAYCAKKAQQLAVLTNHFDS